MKKNQTPGSHRQSCRFHRRTRAASRAFHWTVWRQTPQSWSSLANQDLVLQTVPLSQRVHLYLTEPEYIKIKVTYLLIYSESHLFPEKCRSTSGVETHWYLSCSWNIISLHGQLILGLKSRIDYVNKSIKQRLIHVVIKGHRVGLATF